LGNASDITQVCHRCGAEFIFSQSEQDFYRQKGFSPPTHCRECRSMRRTQNSLVCAHCQQKIEKLADVYCPACSEAPRLETEAEIKLLREALDEAAAKLAAAQAEGAQAANLNARVASLESEKARLQAEADARFAVLEDDKKKDAAESEERTRAAESKIRRLTDLLEKQTHRSSELQDELGRASRALEEANRYRSRLDYLEPALQGIRATLDEMKRAQQNVDRIATQLASEDEEKRRRNPGALAAVKRLFGNGRKSSMSSS
jgi:hypothetical protein